MFTQTMNLQTIPFDIQFHILSQLDPFKVLQYRRVCRSFDCVLTSPSFSHWLSPFMGMICFGKVSTIRNSHQRLVCIVTPSYCGKAVLQRAQSIVTSETYSQGRLCAYKSVEMFPIEGLEPLLIPHNAIDKAGMLANFLPQVDLPNGACIVVGPLPPAINTLKYLTSFEGYGSLVTGPLPANLGAMVQLKLLCLTGNKLEGTIPTILGNLVNLTALRLRGNGFTGSIPVELQNLVNLVDLVLSDNKLSGPVPDIFGGMASLRYLSMSGNSLEGPIPDSIGCCLGLVSFRCDRNNFSGVVPESLIRLPLLEHLNLSGNALTNIPVPHWHKFNQLMIPIESDDPLDDETRRVHLANNRLTGTFLEIISNLTLDVSASASPQPEGSMPNEQNNIVSTLPNMTLSVQYPADWIATSIFSITNISHLSFDHNCLDGPLPAEIGRMVSLRRLRLGHNRLSGPIPASISQLVWLKQLDLSNNCFNETIPDAIGALVRISLLDLSNNRFVGRVPVSLDRCAMLTRLDLKGNSLEGDVPRRFRGMGCL
ncbi:hypothetical protein HDU81_007542 [Chytriomyces hyalinus]|nr:hypothetical protein HDU81_007542 [Chytriomyces hyalinus]